MIWSSMVKRCNNPNDKGYYNYGGRGIKVCERWRTFENFLEDMGEKPEGMSIERINNNSDYCPENCKWATRKEQNSNTRRTIKFSYNGKTQNLKEWAKETGITYATLVHRYHAGCSPDDMFAHRNLKKRSG